MAVQGTEALQRLWTTDFGHRELLRSMPGEDFVSRQRATRAEATASLLAETAVD